MRLNRPLRLRDVCFCLQSSDEFSRRIIRQLMSKKILRPVKYTTVRHHEYVLEENVRSFFW
ncbi:hypothetical protein SD71_17620 [Cohnella kolymensis]|uniref:HTH hxlR-type domain-containing protein n=1 Tax=Cohnella kolymensis TaxID=1590652 RepID=A0ABR5A191_9BACL|nr:hypothetical protein SD71_17620 [Cohnella kolymensis]